MYNPNSNDPDREYFPSHNTTRFQDQPEPNLAVLDNFIRVTQQHEKDLERQGINVDQLRYGADRQVVDIFSSASTANDAPLFVFIHGGYWQMLDKSHSCSLVGPLVRRGFRVAVMDYNLCPSVTLEELMSQFEEFLNWIFDYAQLIKVSKITFAGHSAGAHLLARILNSQELINANHHKMVWALIFMCGVYDLRELWNLESVNPKNILGINGPQAEALSPMLWEYTNAAAWSSTHMYVIVAEHDSVTFIEQSRRFAQALSESGFKATFQLFDKYDHFDIIEDTALDESRITRFLTNIRNA
ncbi:hypothetical protein KR009_004747 [Drosophila setifemur]|nr:hypothetical protein KR009_004747 [Drosophila setifemur]